MEKDRLTAIKLAWLLKKSTSDIIILLLYVGDIHITLSLSSLLKSIIKTLMSGFSMRDLGLVNFFLGISVSTCKGSLFSSKPFNTPLSPKYLSASDTSHPFYDPLLYHSLVGRLQYLTFTHYDIAFSFSQLARFMYSPLDIHLTVFKHILRYLYYFLNLGLFSSSGSIGNKQSVVSRSSGEEKYHFVAHGTVEISWLLSLLGDIHIQLSSRSKIYCDNISIIYLAQSHVHHTPMKQIEIDIKCVREKVAFSFLHVHYVSSADQLADLLRKSLPCAQFSFLHGKLNISRDPTFFQGE
uniref:Reverse transcriptase Ty1/copia-type domain-containing protein n=1 Tax=Solanum lycopersicum TaxID=4081 RepID=A0A3Q7GSK8_SOLLC